MNITQSIQNALNKPGVSGTWLMWIKAKNRETGELEAAGINSSIYDMTYVVEGEARTYRGVGSLIGLNSISYSIGTNIENQSISVSLLDSSVVEMVRLYDSANAPCELHLAIFNPENESLTGIVRVCEGFIDGISIPDTDDNPVVSFEIASSIRGGARVNPAKQSDAAQRLRNPNDEGRKYQAISGAPVPVYWGEKSNDDFWREKWINRQAVVRKVSHGLFGRD